MTVLPVANYLFISSAIFRKELFRIKEFRSTRAGLITNEMGSTNLRT